MEWSGNFSKEEYLALAQDLSEEDIPGIVTLESFKCAAKNGSVSLSPKHPPRWRKKGDESSTRSTAARDAAQEGSCHGYHVSASPVARRVGQRHRRTRGGLARGTGRVATRVAWPIHSRRRKRASFCFVSILRPGLFHTPYLFSTQLHQSVV